MNKIAEQIGFNRNVVEKAKTENAMKLMGKTVSLSPNLVAKIATKAISKTIKRTIDKGMGIEIGM